MVVVPVSTLVPVIVNPLTSKLNPLIVKVLLEGVITLPVTVKLFSSVSVVAVLPVNVRLPTLVQNPVPDIVSVDPLTIVNVPEHVNAEVNVSVSEVLIVTLFQSMPEVLIVAAPNNTKVEAEWSMLPDI